MRQENRWWLVQTLILLMAISGCDTDRASTRDSLSEGSRIVDLWSIYTHCYRSKDPDAMRVDVQRLSLATSSMDSAENDVSPEDHDSSPMGPPVRLSVDPTAMVASCALHTGLVAQAMGRLYVAREMFQMIVIKFPHPRYRYYTAQARQGLERLDAVSRALSAYSM